MRNVIIILISTFLTFLLKNGAAVPVPMIPTYSHSFRNDSAARNFTGHIFLLLTTAVPTEEMAKKFARDMVGQGMAGLVNIFQPSVSVYKWDEELREVQENILFIYTQASQFDRVEEYIRANHVDEEPGVVAIPIFGGSSSFLNWLGNQTQPHPKQLEQWLATSLQSGQNLI